MRSHEILTGVDRGMLMHPVSSAPYGPAVGRPLRPPPPRSRPGESRAVYSQQVAYAPHNNVPGRHSSHSSTDQTSSGGYTLSGGHDVQSHERMHPPWPQQQQRPSGRPPPPFDGRREQGSLQHQHQARPSVDLTNGKKPRNLRLPFGRFVVSRGFPLHSWCEKKLFPLTLGASETMFRIPPNPPKSTSPC